MTKIRDTFGERQSEIEFKFSDVKGKIYIRHPNFPEISSDVTTFKIIYNEKKYNLGNSSFRIL